MKRFSKYSVIMFFPDRSKTDWERWACSSQLTSSFVRRSTECRRSSPWSVPLCPTSSWLSTAPSSWARTCATPWTTCSTPACPPTGRKSPGSLPRSVSGSPTCWIETSSSPPGCLRAAPHRSGWLASLTPRWVTSFNLFDLLQLSVMEKAAKKALFLKKKSINGAAPLCSIYGTWFSSEISIIHNGIQHFSVDNIFLTLYQ